MARRERHEGLLGWLARGIAAPVRALVAAVVGVLREVGALLAGIARPFRRIVPGAPRGSTTWDSVFGRSRRVTRVTAKAPLTEAARRAADRRRTLTRRRARVAFAVVLVGVVVATWRIVPASDAFRIRHVEVTGASSISDLEVRGRVDRLLTGSTVFTVDEEAVERRIEEFPFVRDATVVRHLPGGLELRIVEYRPLALGISGTRSWLVARDGRVLARADAAEWTDRVPVVQLLGRQLRPGDRIGDEPALRLLASRADDSTMAFKTVDIVDGQIVAALEDGVEVRFGRATALRAKTLVAERVRQEAARRDFGKLLYIDVTVAGRAAVCRDDVAACHLAREVKDADPVVEGAAVVAEIPT